MTRWVIGYIHEISATFILDRMKKLQSKRALNKQTNKQTNKQRNRQSTANLQLIERNCLVLWFHPQCLIGTCKYTLIQGDNTYSSCTTFTVMPVKPTL